MTKFRKVSIRTASMIVLLLGLLFGASSCEVYAHQNRGVGRAGFKKTNNRNRHNNRQYRHDNRNNRHHGADLELQIRK